MKALLNCHVIELRLWNFRAFRWAYLPLADLTVLVGPNGAGKTTVAQALTVISEGLNAGLEVALLHSDGALSLRSRPTGNSDRLGVAVKVRAAGRDWVYGFILKFGSANTYVVEEEKLHPLPGSDQAYGFSRQRSKVNATQANEIGESMADAPQGFLALPTVAGGRPEWMEVLDLLRRIRCYQLIAESIRSPYEAKSASVSLTKDGSNAADVLYHLRNSRTKGWIVEHLHQTTIGVVDLLTKRVYEKAVRAEGAAQASGILGAEEQRNAAYSKTYASEQRTSGTTEDAAWASHAAAEPFRTPSKTFDTLRYLAILQQVNGTTEEFGMHGLSDGTARMLGALLTLRQEPTPSLVFFDQLTEWHPPSWAVLMDAIVACLDKTQVIIATHSIEALSHSSITGERVRLFCWANGESHIHLLRESVRRLLKPPESVGGLLSQNALWPEESPLAIPVSDDVDKASKFLGGA